MGRRSSKEALNAAMQQATRVLEPPLTLPEAPETFRAIYDSTLSDCRKEAATYGFGDDAFLTNHVRTRLHSILQAPDEKSARYLSRSIWEGVQVHLILVAHRAGKLARADGPAEA